MEEEQSALLWWCKTLIYDSFVGAFLHSRSGVEFAYLTHQTARLHANE